MDEDILHQIIYQAQSTEISLTNFVNQIIKSYLEWNRFEPKAGVIMLSASIVKELFGNLTVEQIIYLAKSTIRNIIDSTLVKYARGEKKTDLNFFLSWLEDEMNIYFTEIRHVVSKDRGHIGYAGHKYRRLRHHIFVLKHDSGLNYSLYYKTVLESIFNGILQKHICVRSTDNRITFEFED